MKERWDFLKKSDKSLGLFYPMHYTIAGFESLEDADAAYERFIADGFADDDVASISGPFMVDYLHSEEGRAWYDKVLARFVEIFGTETGFLDDDVTLAERGGAFVFVYTPNQAQVEKARAVIERVQPVYARRYHRAGIERIAHPSKDSTLQARPVAKHAVRR